MLTVSPTAVLSALGHQASKRCRAAFHHRAKEQFPTRRDTNCVLTAMVAWESQTRDPGSHPPWIVKAFSRRSAEHNLMLNNINTSDQLVTRLLQDIDVSTSSGQNFLQPKSDICLRLCLVDFDGGMALENCPEVINSEWLTSYCGNTIKAIEAISSGGFFGKGIGEGTLKTRVPEAHTDYIVSVIAEEFGVVTIILLLFLFLFLIYSVFKKVNLEESEKIKLILVGSVSLIIFQVLIHLGVNIRLFPTTGMTLPFLSYGGSSIISVSILSGIILNLTKRKIN